jgi:hypothetical protein
LDYQTGAVAVLIAAVAVWLLAVKNDPMTQSNTTRMTRHFYTQWHGYFIGIIVLIKKWV